MNAAAIEPSAGPVSAARLVLPRTVLPFIAACSYSRLEVIADESFIDVIAEGCNAGVCYEERLEHDMIAMPIGPRIHGIRSVGLPAARRRRGSLSVTAGNPVSTQPGRYTCAWAWRRISLSTPKSPDTGAAALFEDWLQPHFNSSWKKGRHAGPRIGCSSTRTRTRIVVAANLGAVPLSSRTPAWHGSDKN